MSVVLLADDVLRSIEPALKRDGIRALSREAGRYRGITESAGERRISDMKAGRSSTCHAEVAEALLYAATGSHHVLAALPHFAASTESAVHMIDGWAFSRDVELNPEEVADLALSLTRFSLGFVIGATDTSPNVAKQLKRTPNVRSQVRRQVREILGVAPPAPTVCAAESCTTPLRPPQTRFCSRRCADRTHQRTRQAAAQAA